MISTVVWGCPHPSLHLSRPFTRNSPYSRSNVQKLNQFKGYSLIEVTVVVAVVLIAMAFAIPMVGNILRSVRIGGDARDIADFVGQAKLRAASDFARARVYIDLTNVTFRIDLCKQVPGAVPANVCKNWVQEVGSQNLVSSGVNFGFGTLNAPPPNTAGAIAQAPLCQSATDPGVTPNTACIVFNSRGLPIDVNGNPIANDALYITDGNSVWAVTVAMNGLIQTWRSAMRNGAPGWLQR